MQSENPIVLGCYYMNQHGGFIRSTCGFQFREGYVQKICTMTWQCKTRCTGSRSGKKSRQLLQNLHPLSSSIQRAAGGTVGIPVHSQTKEKRGGATLQNDSGLDDGHHQLNHLQAVTLAIQCKLERTALLASLCELQTEVQTLSRITLRQKQKTKKWQK